MKNPFEIFETDTSAEVDGVWQNFGAFRALLARSGGKNTLYGKTLDEEVKKLGKATLSAISTTEADDVVSKVFAKVCIKSHEVQDSNGKWSKGIFIKKAGKVEVVPFNLKNMQTCLIQLPEYFKKLREYADDFTTFQAEVEKETIKK